MREKDWAPRRLSLEAGLAENAVGRILERPERETRHETWQKLAAYLKWDLRDVERLAYGAAPDTDEPDPWGLLDAAMRGFHLGEKYREHIRRQVEFLLQANQVEPPAPC